VVGEDVSEAHEGLGVWHGQEQVDAVGIGGSHYVVDRATWALVVRSHGCCQGWGDIVEFTACTEARIGETAGVRRADIKSPGLKLVRRPFEKMPARAQFFDWLSYPQASTCTRLGARQA
jgi:hypothetical protein